MQFEANQHIGFDKNSKTIDKNVTNLRHKSISSASKPKPSQKQQSKHHARAAKSSIVQYFAPPPSKHPQFGNDAAVKPEIPPRVNHCPPTLNTLTLVQKSVRTCALPRNSGENFSLSEITKSGGNCQKD